LEKYAWDKCSNLLRKFVAHDGKKFYNIGLLDDSNFGFIENFWQRSSRFGCLVRNNGRHFGNQDRRKKEKKAFGHQVLEQARALASRTRLLQFDTVS
jgi:hypothetical protein